MAFFIFGQIIQFIGIAVPLMGCIALFRKEQSKVSMSLMLTNIGCLFINATYLLLIMAKNFDEAFMALKVQYMANAFFYFSFMLFLFTYLGFEFGKWRTGFLTGFAVLEMLVLACMWIGDPYHFIFEELRFLEAANGFIFVEYVPGTLYMVHNCIISMLLFIGIILSMIKMFTTKVVEVKENIAKLVGAQFLVAVPLILMLLYQFPYDVFPIFSSLSILSIILSVLRGEFFQVTDRGREWVIEHTDNALIVTDKMYGFLDANAYAKEIFPELKSLKSRKIVSDELKALLESQEDDIEIKGRRYSKRIAELEQRGKVAGYGLLLIDITEELVLLEQLEVEKERAEQANEAKSMFMSNMSHEIRTPMNAIVGMTEILLREDLPKHDKEYLNNIKSSGNALLTIINDILDFSKIESGKMEIIEDIYEPMSLFHDLSMIFLNRIGEKEVELLYDIDKKLPKKLFGDDKRIRQVIINLMNNAIKFTDEGYVKLSVKMQEAEDDNCQLYFRIEDSGQGIKEEDIGKLFGSFQQVDMKMNRYKEGTGLGLSICKQLVELMGGTIGVESTYGKGSTFWFSLSQKKRSEKPAAAIKQLKTEELVIGGKLSNVYTRDSYQNVAKTYGIHTITIEEAMESNTPMNFFFTDDIENLSVEQKQKLKLWNTKLCVLQNPMQQNMKDIKALLVNKPLYSLNFCQIINNEEMQSVNEEDELSFIAPKAKILIVDDNEMNLKVAKGLLAPLQMQIETADGGKKALQKIKQKHYDIVFMDHMMPGMDGVEVTKAVRALSEEYYKNLPIVALTANATTDAREIFKKNGLNDFVAKPIKIKAICKCIKKWLPDELMEENNKVIFESSAHLCQNADEQLSDKEEDKLQIEGLNVQEGIENSGSEELFFSLLGDFYKLIDQKATKIEKCLADGMLKDYTIEVHALKSTARMIGAMELSEKFYRLEQLGNAEEQKILEKETPSVLSLYRSYKPILEPYGRMLEQDKERVPMETIIEDLRLLKDSMDCFDLDGADEAMHRLETYVFPQDCQSKVESLSAYVADVAMEEVMEICGQLISELENK